MNKGVVFDEEVLFPNGRHGGGYVNCRKFMSNEEKKKHDSYLNKLRNSRCYLRKKEERGDGSGYTEDYKEREELRMLRLKYYVLENSEYIKQKKLNIKQENKALKRELIYVYKLIDVLQKELDEMSL